MSVLPSAEQAVQETGASRPAELPEVAFVLGILQRSGTNYLNDLLERHPDCASLRTIGEDFLVANADRLDAFVRGVTGMWNAKWDPDGRRGRQLLGHLGTACLEFLADSARESGAALPRCLVTKSPSVANLRLAPLFPHAKTVVIVRDGPAVLESGMKAFGWTFETAARRWAEGARTITAAARDGVPFLLVRYEDLLTNLRPELSRVLDHLGLDPAAYDFEGAERMPVRGSSFFGTDQGQVHWQQVSKTADFNPLDRGSGWGASRRERFRWIAGAEMVSLGYEAGGGRRPRFFWNGWNQFQDLWRKLPTLRGLVRRASGRGRGAV